MKRFYLLGIIMVTVISFLPAFDKSIGTEVKFEGYQTDYLLSSDYYASAHYLFSYNLVSIDIFYSLKYFTLGCGYSLSLGGEHYKTTGFASNSSSTADKETTNLRLNAFAQYPIQNNGFVFIPKLGVEYRHNLTYLWDGIDYKPYLTTKGLDDLNELWIKCGGSFDFDINENLYTRITALIGYKFNSELEKTNADKLENDYSQTDVSCSTFGYEVGIGLGYKL